MYRKRESAEKGRGCRRVEVSKESKRVEKQGAVESADIERAMECAET